MNLAPSTLMPSGMGATNPKLSKKGRSLRGQDLAQFPNP